MELRNTIGVSDMTEIPEIDENGINDNLKLRYDHDIIYTYTGSILVAVNPYKFLNIYNKAFVYKYHGNKLGTSTPHVFALAEAAYKNIIDDGMNQSVVISGESGAGKTESTKFILQYLCTITSSVSTWVQQQILEANTILEAFGNAKTVRNDNSSRFGKFMQVCFNSDHSIKGCIIQDYLLEQSRITFQSAGERNYHVLYQLVSHGQKNEEMRKILYLRKDPYMYRYLNASGNVEIDIEVEAKKFEQLKMALTVLQISEIYIDGVLKVLSAILWLGNLDFSDVDGEKCELLNTDEEICKIVANLLGMNEKDIKQVLLHRQINVRGNVTEIPLKIQEACENRHAMAKALYSRTFQWLLTRINSCTNPGQDGKCFLGVLDIFGFENFVKNSFEQLCINYTNEKLHKFFNHYVFILEQDIYKNEEIQYSHIEFTDNSLCLELIEKPPRCIFKLLTEQCHMPKGSDTAYLNNLHAEFENNPYYVKGIDRRHWESEFGIKHYAGCVIYAANGFVDKNRDVQQDVFFYFMSRSENSLVRELSNYQEMQIVHTQGSVTIQKGTSKSKYTVSDSFRQQLQNLIDVLQNTRPWYVRCIKPNSEKLPNSYNKEMVLDQLNYLGMLDIIRIRREGYPVHLNIQEFLTQYKCLLKNKKSQYTVHDVASIMEELCIPEKEWQIGKTKIFLRNKAFEPLRELRREIITSKAITIQKVWRGYIQKKNYGVVRSSALKIQHAYRGWKLRIEFLRKRRAAVIIQSHLRGVFAREVAAALREMRRVDEEMKRREKSRENNNGGDTLSQPANDFGDEATSKALEDCESLLKEEMIALTNMANQISSKHVCNGIAKQLSDEKVNGEIATAKPMRHNSNESVDLDNIFAFLSEVTPHTTKKSLIAEIEDNMDDLVKNLKKELEHCGNEKAYRHTVEPTATELTSIPQNPAKPTIKGVPSLPEPNVPPPPPPKEVFSNKTLVVEIEKTSQDHGLATKLNDNRKPQEPIYEAVLGNHFNKNMSNHIQSNFPNESRKPDIESYIGPSMADQPKNLTVSNSIKPNYKIQPQPTPTPSSPRAMQIGGVAKMSEEVLFTNEREQRRKYRVEKKLLEMQQNSLEIPRDAHLNDTYFDILEYADNYFNNHERALEGTIISTLTRKGKKLNDTIPKYEMVTFLRTDKIPTSHIHMYDPENIVLACNMFRELNKYMRGELNAERELQAIQYIISLGIEREELRDEIFVQCIRQTTNNPNTEWLDRLWLLMCLIIVAFQPSKLLFRYFVSYLKKNLEILDGKLRQFAHWCFDNCKCTKVSARFYPPSSVEVAAMKRLGTIVCRFFFLDGRTKAIDVHPTDTAGDAVVKLADKLILTNTEGWAIFQSRPDGEEHIKSHDYLYDVIAAWEIKQLKLQQSSNSGTSGKGLSQGSGSGENRFVFKKRLFKSTRELSQDPVEVNMLYAQAVYSVVKCDDFPVSEKVALQLAGLQAQVALGDPANQPKPEYYADVNHFLPVRISKTREKEFWVPILAQAHRQYGASRNELTAKVLYLSCVMQYPLYGTTLFSVIYKGYWNFGSNLTLGINNDGVLLIQTEEKLILYQFKYSDVESIMIDPSDSFITITLNRNAEQQIQVSKRDMKSLNVPPEVQRCFVFETSQKNEIGNLIASYYPPLSCWITNNFENCKKTKGITNEDRIRLYNNVVMCRRQLIDSDIVHKPHDAGGFLRNTLRRLSKHRLEKLRSEQRNNIQDNGEIYKGFPHSFWAFSRQPLAQCLSKLCEADEITMIQIFQSILTYSGLANSGELVQRVENEQITVVQSIMDKCMRKEALLNELYLQLIKQTTDHPDPNSRINLRHWALLSLTCSVVLPTVRAIRKYLISHLKRCASDYITEEGKFARFAEKLFYKTQGSRRRQWPPSREEIMCTINRRPCYARFHFMDGQFYSIEFQPSSTALEVIEVIKRKIGLKEKASGYAIYEVLGTYERSLMMEEKLCDVISKWEKYRNSSQQALQGQTNIPANPNVKHHQPLFLFKKHLFVDGFINLDDAVEKELLYHQVLHSLRSERFPITEMEAIMLTALQGQVEMGDCGDTLNDYRVIASHCLPPRFVPNIPHEAVALHHQSLRGMLKAEVKKSFLNLIQSWPLHKATIFDVMQSFTSNWPRILWLAVDQIGIHLLEHRSRNVLCTHDYESLISYSPNMNSLMIFTGTDRKQSKVILSTIQAFQIATLIKEYSEIFKARKANQLI